MAEVASQRDSEAADSGASQPKASSAAKYTPPSPKSYEPFSDAGLIAAFHGGGSFTKHLLTIYSMAVGCQAKAIIDLGIGSTTRAMRAAAQKTGGRVFSCDINRERFGALADYSLTTDDWRLYISDSIEFIANLEAGIEFVSHDGAHDYKKVKADLLGLIPKMRRFGLITVHDTQHPTLGRELTRAVREVSQELPITWTALPYNCGLAIIRVEESEHGEISPTGLLKGDRVITAPFSLLE